MLTIDSTSSYPDQINVVIPLFNDWQALGLLLERINAVCEPELVQRMAFWVIDDSSVTEPETLPSGIGRSLGILRLFRNMGHQKAIALGLSYLASLPAQYPTIVMDSDGEDRPEDIPRLLAKGITQQGHIVFAERTKRHESFGFRLFYEVYKNMFRLLTGKVITFGNFSLIPAPLLRKLAHVSEIWNNYPGGVIRSRLPYTALPLERGQRLAGESKMNFVSLVLHGLSAVSVLIDTTAVRLVLFCVMMVATSILGITVVVAIRLLTNVAVPGLAIYLVFSFLIVILQAFLISLMLVFIVLSYRTQPQFIPARQFLDYVEKVEKIY